MALRIATGVDKLKRCITGYALINVRDDISFERKVQLDQEYLHTKSILLDIEIIFKTFTNVLFSEGVSHYFLSRFNILNNSHFTSISLNYKLPEYPKYSKIFSFNFSTTYSQYRK
jgi:hypothetical protein